MHEDFYELLRKHQEEDKRQMAALEDRMTALATKEDAEQIKDLIKNIKIGFGLVNVSGRVVVFFGALVVAIIAITGGFKALLVALGFSLTR